MSLEVIWFPGMAADHVTGIYTEKSKRAVKSIVDKSTISSRTAPATSHRAPAAATRTQEKRRPVNFDIGTCLSHSRLPTTRSTLF